eukprot:Phypoly_transcript_08627.p1 GENE.Phypoly_transcript_08627~~Phypoly_transcript_08627.p1  ORF type:complete len:434 (+),score=66.26 Phypoly_transcript_08627:107-1408(+)
MESDKNKTAMGPGETALEPNTKKIPELDDHHKENTVDKFLTKFFHLGHNQPDARVTTDVETSERILEEALAHNNQPSIPPDASRERDISKVCVVHPSLQAPTHARQVAVKRVLLLYNPHSGAQKGEKIAAEAKQLFSANHIDVHAIALERSGHGESLCNTMDIKPFDVLCFIGGDGTFHECVNGLLKRKDGMGSVVPIAMIAGGTGNSFSLELLGDTDVKLAVDTIVRGIHAPVDVGKVVQLDMREDGHLGNEVIFSFNSIHWGLASKVSMTAEKLRWMGKAVRYTTAALMEIINGNSSWAAIQFEDSEGNVVEYKEKFCLAIANNIVTAAKGMKMAPKAKLNDGLMDLLLIRSHKTLDLLSIFTKVYEGTHTDLDYVEYKQVKWFSIIPFNKEGEVVLDEEECEDVVDIDGELKGATPFRCEVIRNAIKVII